MTKKQLTPDELKELLVESIANFPELFNLDDHKGRCRILPHKSEVTADGKERLHVVDEKTGKEVGVFTAKLLQSKVVAKERPAGKEKPKRKREGLKSHVEYFRELVLAGKTRAEIFQAFKLAFATHRKPGHENVLTDKNVRSRIYLYRWQCATRYPEVRQKLNDMRIVELKEQAENAAKGAPTGNGTEPPKASTKKAGKKKGDKKASQRVRKQVEAETKAVEDAAKKPLKEPKKAAAGDGQDW